MMLCADPTMPISLSSLHLALSATILQPGLLFLLLMPVLATTKVITCVYQTHVWLPESICSAKTRYMLDTQSF